ncbi:cyclopropane-fatty-acyl-phospholipid synthase family protein [Nocardioides sp. R-C-SC26]|uniref:SAM-dependent methyltransferase n=1 Tax=Nocardioides sp. R-C-SC26 TaxID=2870414 RepID=UPI001E608CD9|nr:cyclopropane-fatty-acyl-phospholipid synthase family protein [Nocardioides sp. R-C-SC26]
MDERHLDKLDDRASVVEESGRGTRPDVTPVVEESGRGTRPDVSKPGDPTAHRNPGPATGVAPKLAAAVQPFLGGELPVRLRAWDGSEAGSPDGPLVVLNSPDAVRRLLWHPGELGAAQAYVTGELDVPEVDGWNLDKALTYAFAVAQQRGLSGARLTPSAIAKAVRAAVGIGAFGRPPAAPASQAQIKGRLHSLSRDRRSISHHYDLSNEFYSLILEENMAYSSGYHSAPEQPLTEAQSAKLSLVCTKLGLEPGMRFLDVGCGWGSLSLHAAEHFGAQVVGVTIAAEQKKFIDARIAERGLEGRVEIRLQDYREVPERDHFDAVGSIEMGEHVGQRNYPTYVEVLRRAVKPGGRVLIQQMSRTGKWPGGGPFIESFIAPDMYMRPVGETVGMIEAGGLEVRDVHALREHYVLTVAGWLERFEANIERLTELVGEEVVRVWRLYLVGGSMAFRDGRMGVDQILSVRPGGQHTLPAVRTW